MFTVALLSVSASFLAQYVPFAYELQISEQYSRESEQHPEQEKYLNALAGRLIAVMGLPEGMKIRVHYSDADIVNAFATLGGNIMMYRGLLEKLPNENAIAMVLAHEIAHIKHRDPLASLGRGATVGIFMSVLGLQDAGSLLGKAGLFTLLKFNRDMENEADKAALEALQLLYGHVEGARALFDVIEQVRHEEGESGHQIQFLLTHPLGENRIKRIQQFAHLNPSKFSEMTPIPETFIKALKLHQEDKD